MMIAPFHIGPQPLQPHPLQGLQVGGVVESGPLPGLQLVQHLEGEAFLAQLVEIVLKLPVGVRPMPQAEALAVHYPRQVPGRQQEDPAVGVVPYSEDAHLSGRLPTGVRGNIFPFNAT